MEIQMKLDMCMSEALSCTFGAMETSFVSVATITTSINYANVWEYIIERWNRRRLLASTLAIQIQLMVL